MSTRLIIIYVTREVLQLVGMGVALFWSAGRVDWLPAWGALAVMAGWSLATAVIIFRINPGLMAERLGARKGSKSWDNAIVSTLGLTTLTRYILAGMDLRHGWSGGFDPAAQITAFVLCALGYALFTWATAANAYFSQVTRIQTERGHAVATGGPYRFVRHPAYLGAIVYELAVGILLASWWCVLVSVLDAALLVLRTALEDRTLRAELPGYAEYARKVRFRLLPGVW